MAKKRKVTARSKSKKPTTSLMSSDWMQSIYESQTGRTIVAEMLVAAAGVAAAVLLSEKGRKGAHSLVKAGRDSASTGRQALTRAGSATGDVLDSAIERASVATNIVAKKVGLKPEPTQHDLAEKALEMRKEGEGSHSSRPSTEPHPRAPSREG